MSDLEKKLTTALDAERTQQLEAENRKLQGEARKLRERNRRLQDQTLEIGELKRILGVAADHDPDPPGWLRESKRGAWKHGTPTLNLTDLHWGEIVYREQVNGVNEYNHEIARARLHRVFDTTLALLFDCIAAPDYPGITVNLLGDIVCGYIHDELKENASLRLFPSAFDARDCLIAGIDMLKRELPHVFVVGVVGNHGRLDEKPRHKWAVVDNVDWLVYTLLQEHYQGDPKVTVKVPAATSYQYRIYGTRYYLDHGNDMRGGSGISGAATPWAIGDYRTRTVQDALDLPFDTRIFGHWHQSAWGIGDIYMACGTLKGYDEFAKDKKYRFERPNQPLFLTHWEHGMTFRWKVYGDEPADRPRYEWVSIPEQEAT